MANTKQLIDATSAELNVTKALTEKVVTTFLAKAAESLQAGEDVTLRNFGRLFPHPRDARIGRNPKTGEAIEIPSKVVAKFKPRGVLAGDISSPAAQDEVVAEAA